MRYERDPLECRYASHEDIKTKLNGSWVYYDNEPVRVTTGVDIDDYKKIQIEAIRGSRWGGRRTVSVLDPLLDQYNLKYGWFNSPEVGRAVLSSRIPSRRYKQGIHNEVLSMTSPCNSETFSQVSYDVLSIDAMMRGVYPSVEKAVEVLDYDGSSVALSRDVALVRIKGEIRVYVGENNVGKFHKTSLSVEVEEEGVFSIISGLLQEAGL